jgi:hypothetical protein
MNRIRRVGLLADLGIGFRQVITGARPANKPMLRGTAEANDLDFVGQIVLYDSSNAP